VSAVATIDGVALDLATLGVAQLVHRARVTSTMDVAHEVAASGAPHGTLIVADVQDAGRGRGGKRWHSAAADGLWMTWLLRDVTVASLALLSLRTGLAIAEAVAPHVDGFVGLKWPNDVLTAHAPDRDAARTQPASALAKLAGVLVETRWRDQSLDWVAIGIGINTRIPQQVDRELARAGRRASAVRADTPRATLLATLAPTLLTLGARTTHLSPSERDAWVARDVAVSRCATSPAVCRQI
jgi:BirA family transcriptional regulator, biotin operon repressor / biotin---[acetyl-CoA-carboxylase] ligase